MYGLKDVRRRYDDGIARIDWAEMERLLAAYYRGQGWKVEHCGTAGHAKRFDGGIDLKLRREAEYVLVQCKHWNAKQVPHNAVHELIGIMVNEGATGAILVSSGEFTQAASDAAARQPRLRLIDGDGLREMLGPMPVPSRIEAPPYRDALKSMATMAGERMLSAAEDRIRGESGRVALRAANAAALLLLPKIVLIALSLLFMWLGVRFAVDTMRQVQTTMPEPSAAAQAALPMPAVSAVSAGAAESGEDRGVATEAARNTPRRLSEAEIREAQRRADEAMKVIEATTPEM